jgi:hypothetical protein
LASSIIYVILSEQQQLTFIENLVISLSIGILFAFVALLVQYIGLFLLGVTSSIALSTCFLILIDLFYTNKSAWLCIGLLFLCATVVATVTLRFQKSLTILNTSCIGAALLINTIDYIIENNLLIEYITELYKVNGQQSDIYKRRYTSHKNISTTTTTTTTTIATTTILDKLTNNTLVGVNNGGVGGGGGALALLVQVYSSAKMKLCWYTWLIFGSFFLLLIIGIIIQVFFTAKHEDHRDNWQKCKLFIRIFYFQFFFHRFKYKIK